MLSIENSVAFKMLANVHLCTFIRHFFGKFKANFVVHFTCFTCGICSHFTNTFHFKLIGGNFIGVDIMKVQVFFGCTA